MVPKSGIQKWVGWFGSESLVRLQSNSGWSTSWRLLPSAGARKTNSWDLEGLSHPNSISIWFSHGISSIVTQVSKGRCPKKNQLFNLVWELVTQCLWSVSKGRGIRLHLFLLVVFPTTKIIDPKIHSLFQFYPDSNPSSLDNAICALFVLRARQEG